MDKKYNTGVVWQDFQHRELMNLLIRLKNARADQSEEDEFNFAVAFLSMYVNHHFRLEEKYMDLYDYPDREDHKKAHQTYTRTLRSFRSSHTTYSKEAMDALVSKIHSWVLNHILEDDQKLGAHIITAEKALHQSKGDD